MTSWRLKLPATRVFRLIKHQSCALLAPVKGIRRWPAVSHTKNKNNWSAKCFHVMTSSKKELYVLVISAWTCDEWERIAPLGNQTWQTNYVFLVHRIICHSGTPKNVYKQDSKCTIDFWFIEYCIPLLFVFVSCDQAALWMVQSICPSVHPCHTFLTMFLSSYHHEILSLEKVMSMQRVKVRGHRSRSQGSNPNLAVSGS